jgi:serine/threonine protein kinase
VIRLLLAYEHIERGLYLVFPLAKGDLDDFWKAKDTQFPSSEDAYWLIQQCADIASALYEFHYHPSLPKKHGRHGDIKPENILWFQDQTESHGRLVVADLTMVRFHSTATLDDTTAQGRAISITYKPPEVDVEIKPKKSQAYDVWSLGCVFFQFMVWHLLGYDAARDGQQFLNAQNHWCQSFKRARINNDNAHGWTALEDKFFNVRFDMSSGRLVAEVKESVEQVKCLVSWHTFADLYSFES